MVYIALYEIFDNRCISNIEEQIFYYNFNFISKYIVINI